MPIAVNVDTMESNVKCLPASEIVSSFEGTDVIVALSDEELLDAIEQTRTGMSFWQFFMIAGLIVLVLESLYADRLFKRSSPTNQPAHSPALTRGTT